jgi:asparagine synthase (glutamine-hydrolysing)
VLPREIVWRPKQGFAAPMDEWMRTVWRDRAKHIILESPFVRNGILSRFGVQHLFYLLEHKRQRVGKSIYLLLNLALWHRRYFGC